MIIKNFPIKYNCILINILRKAMARVETFQKGWSNTTMKDTMSNIYFWNLQKYLIPKKSNVRYENLTAFGTKVVVKLKGF